ncbi:MAG TPA: helix-hairpin-helix domain-containing protein [Bacteroidales bacterium]|nr:helix-hairpin-helix domain-containing protein [Bacteroidales bacterium]
MKLNSEPIRNWFGFTRRERSSSFILLIIIVLIIALRYTVPEKSIAIEDITSRFSRIQDSTVALNLEMSPDVPLFSFDPNTVPYDTLIKLGFAAREANTLINYRNNGGKFRKPSDIKKIYGIEENRAEELIPFIKVQRETTKQSVHIYSRQQKSLIDLNRCDSASLVTLAGIGKVLSVRIIKYRHLLGGFARIDQLKEVYGLSEETYNLIKGRLFIDTTIITRIDVNLAGYREFSRLPYFENYEITAILKYRELKGNVNGITDLIENKILTKEKADKVTPYLNFE